MNLLYGTETVDFDKNFLIVAGAHLPDIEAEFDSVAYDSTSKDYGGFAGNSKIESISSMLHNENVNRARYMPQSPNIVATQSSDSEIYLYDLNQDSKTFLSTCTGQTEEGYGLCWNKLEKGLLAAGGNDNIINIYNIQELNTPTKDPLYQLHAHKKAVQDVSWSNFQSNLLCSVGDDCAICIWDLRKDHTIPAFQQITAHTDEINSTEFSPLNEYLLATASSDLTTNVWDIRNLKESLHCLETHSEEVMVVRWNKKNSNVLATGSSDRRIHIYDLSLIGAEQSDIDKGDGPPELLFIHGGHTNRITDLDWNPSEEWMIASMGEDGILQIWEIAENIYNDYIGE